MPSLVYCPVRSCGKSFSSLRYLEDHLHRSTRGRRCGAFQGELTFVCICGEDCRSITEILTHIQLHRNVYPLLGDSTSVSMESSSDDKDSPYEPCSESDDSSLTSDTETSSPPPLLVNSGRRHGTTSPDSLNEEMEERTMSSRSTPIDGYQSDNWDSDKNEDDEGEEENAEIPVRHTGGARCIDVRAFFERLKADKGLSIMFQLYHYCQVSHCTHRSYKFLRALSFFTSFDFIPLSLKGLNYQISGYLEMVCQWPSPRLLETVNSEGTKFKTPIMSPIDAVRVWFSIPGVVDIVRRVRNRQLPTSLTNAASYGDVRGAQVDSERVFSSVADGTWYHDAYIRSIPLFQDACQAAEVDGIEVLPITLGIYEDEFSRTLNSLISESLITLSLLEICDTSFQELSNLVVMLADVRGVKSAGRTQYWKPIVDDLIKLQKGVRLFIDGEECLVIGIPLLLFGDTPAVKNMTGLSPSVSPACGPLMPCRCCTVSFPSLRDSILRRNRAPIRLLQTVQGFWESNSYQTGLPRPPWLTHAMREYGYVQIPELVRLGIQPTPFALGFDLMHCIFLGSIVKHFIYLVELVRRKGRKCIWREISRIYHQYCKRNKISSYWRFSDAKTFKRHMTAGSVREFTAVSLHVLEKIGRHLWNNIRNVHGQSTNWLRYWSIHVNVVQMVEQRSISEASVLILDACIDELLLHFHRDFPTEFVTMNIHYYSHFVDQIRYIGTLKVTSNFSREHLIQIIKPFYANINNINREFSVYKRYLGHLFFSVKELLESESDIEFEFDLEGFLQFDFSSFRFVVLHSNDKEEYFETLDFHRLRFTITSLKCSPFWREHGELDSKSYLLIQNSHGQLQVGRYLEILRNQYDGTVWFALQLSTETTVLNDELFLSKRIQFNLEVTTSAMHLIPVEYFVNSGNTFEMSSSIGYFIRRL